MKKEAHLVGVHKNNRKPMRKHSYVWILMVLLLLILGNIPGKVSASSPADKLQVLSFDQYDINNNGTPDIAILMVNYMGMHFKVTVYDQGQDMQLSGDWQIGTDFVNDTWLFQTETGDQTKLIIRFSRGVSGYSAEVFDDVSGDGTVSCTINENGQIDITEAKFPSVTMTAEKPWILSNEQINYIVQVKVYRPVINYSGVPMKYLPKDGRVAIEQELVDGDQDGIPDYERILTFPDVPSTWGYFRTGMNINIGKVQPPGFKDYFLWPYLGYAKAQDGTTSSIVRRSDDLVPPIQVDWQTGRISGIAQFLPLWGLGDQWHLLATTTLKKGAVNVLDWERFGYYAFSGSSTPDMIFRLIQGGPDEALHTGSKVLYPQQVAYSWHQDKLGTLKWDYKLEMADLHELPSTVVPFQDFSLQEVPFQKYLSEFLSQDWAFATFVAAEKDYVDTNEGIYEWDTLQGVINDASAPPATKILPGSYDAQHNYLYGITDVSPSAYYTDIREGLRGEYADLNGKAQLYFSPIDHKLHLLKAQKGVWNLGGSYEIRTTNLGGDFLNQWVLTKDGQPVKSLYAASGILIYQDADGIQVIHAGVAEALFNAVPPRDKNEWAQLGRKLQENKPGFAPDDFSAMLQQFGQPNLSISKATLKGFHLTPDGFQFDLELQPGFSGQGLELFHLPSSAAGQYVVTYNKGQFSASSLTATHLTINLQSLKNKMFRAGDLNTFQLETLNTNQEDALSLKLSVQAENGNSKVDIGTRQIDLFSNMPVESTFDWQPMLAGNWELSAWVEDAAGNRLAEISFPIPVSEPRQNPVLSITSDAGRLLPAFFILLAFASLIGEAFVIGARRRSP